MWIINIHLSDISVDLQHPAVWDICGLSTFIYMIHLWICNIQLSVISVDYQDSAIWDICKSATFSYLQYVWIIKIQLSDISVDLQHSAVWNICGYATSSSVIFVDMQHPAAWDICRYATFTCLWNLWISNNLLSSQSVNVFDSSHSWFCEPVAFRFLLILHMLEIFHHLVCLNTYFRKLAVVPLSSKIYNNIRQKKPIVCATLILVMHLLHRPFDVS